MDSSSSYYTCTSSMDISKTSPLLDPALSSNKAISTRRVEFAENNNVAISIKSYCNVSLCKNIFPLQYFILFFFERTSNLIIVVIFMIKKTSLIKMLLRWKMLTILRLNFLWCVVVLLMRCVFGCLFVYYYFFLFFFSKFVLLSYHKFSIVYPGNRNWWCLLLNV